MQKAFAHDENWTEISRKAFILIGHILIFIRSRKCTYFLTEREFKVIEITRAIALGFRHLQKQADQLLLREARGVERERERR